MNTTTVSSKFQIVIPKKMRQILQITPGMKLALFPYLNRIELIPLEPLEKSFGMAQGIDTNVDREHDRDL